MIKFTGILLATVVAMCHPARAWWDAGHMQIAYVAYNKLDEPVRAKVDALLRLNPDYPKWTAGLVEPTTAKLHAFIRASVWADDIKGRDYNYIRDKVTDPTAGQNIGYSDRNQHAYWHYKDVNWSPDGTPIPNPDPIDAVTQIRLLLAALLPSSGVSDDVRSYDLVWLIHLVGDAHQPLHAVGRFTQANPKGDAGGNSEIVVSASGAKMKLHAYWDGVFGGYSSSSGAIFDADAAGGLAHLTVDATAAAVSDPQLWISESFELAKKFAYADPVPLDNDETPLTREYETNARDISRSQAALAASRLANAINAALR